MPELIYLQSIYLKQYRFTNSQIKPVYFNILIGIFVTIVYQMF